MSVTIGRAQSPATTPTGRRPARLRVADTIAPPPTDAVAGPTVAFVASLAVGLASAGWDAERAAGELAAAAEEQPHVLDGAHARVLERFVEDRGGAVRATRLLDLARSRLRSSSGAAS